MAPRDLLDYYLGPTGIPDRIRALNELNPVAGIMRGMSAAGRAADPSRPAEDRRSAAGEAAMETGIALLPVGMGRLASSFRVPGQMASSSADVVETFTGARPEGLDTLIEDPSRRRFLQGAAAAGVTSAAGPEVVESMARMGARAAPDLGRAAGLLREASQMTQELLKAYRVFDSTPDMTDAQEAARAGLFEVDVGRGQIYDQLVDSLARSDVGPEDLRRLYDDEGGAEAGELAVGVKQGLEQRLSDRAQMDDRFMDDRGKFNQRFYALRDALFRLDHEALSRSGVFDEGELRLIRSLDETGIEEIPF